MTKGWNSILGFAKPTELGEVQEAIGITKYSTEDETIWPQLIGGLLFQGGRVSVAGRVNFQAPYTQQVLGVFVNNGNASAVDLEGFTISTGNYWFAVGV